MHAVKNVSRYGVHTGLSRGVLFCAGVFGVLCVGCIYCVRGCVRSVCVMRVCMGYVISESVFALYEYVRVVFPQHV